MTAPIHKSSDDIPGGRSRVRTVHVALAVLSVILIAPSERSLAQVTTARLSGTALTGEGDPLAGAHIVARHLGSGAERGAVTASGGRYQLPLLDPGDYSLTATYVGFAAETKTPITLHLGQVLTVDFTLEASIGASDTLIVSADPPVIELTESTYRTVISPVEIENVPLNSRRVVELALLTPGTSRERDLFMLSPVHFGATTYTEVALFLDGLDVSANHLGGLLAYAQPVGMNALDQFEVLTGGFPAKYGNGAGVINMITRTGGNQIQGSSFLHYRDEKLSNKNHFVNEELDLTRYQFGITLGGPIVRDRTTFFAAFEHSQLDEGRAVITNGAFPEIEGTFVAPDRNTNLTLRLDHRLNTQNSVTASYTGHSSTGQSGTGGILAENAGVEGGAEIHYFVASHKWLASNRLQLETRAGYLHSDGTTKTLSDDPGLWYPSAYIGSSPIGVRGNSLIREQRWQLRSDATYLIPEWNGDHVVSGGAHLQHSKNRDQVEWWANGQFLFATDTSPFPYLAIIGSPSDITVEANRISVWLQDDWRVHSKLTLNLGMRYDVDLGAINEDYVSPRDDPALPFTANGDRGSDLNNLAPRLGLAWVPFGDRKTVVRGNYGVYYSRMPTAYAVGEQIGDVAPIYFIPGPGTTDLDEISLDGVSPGIMLILPSEFQTPYSHQVSLGLSRQIIRDVAVDVQYVGIWGHNEVYRQNDINPLDASTFQRPLDQYGDVKLARNDGRSNYNAIHFVLRSRPRSYAQFRAFYSLSWANNDFDDTFFTPMFARGPALWDNRHRFVFQGNITLPGLFVLSGTATIESARPFAVVTGTDDNGNTMLDDDLPPGLGRNSSRTEAVQILDARISKHFQIGSGLLEAYVEAFNLLNEVNYLGSSYTGKMTSDNFGQPSVALAPRQLQLGLRASF
jgi:hypothetical protein